MKNEFRFGILLHASQPAANVRYFARSTCKIFLKRRQRADGSTHKNMEAVKMKVLVPDYLVQLHNNPVASQQLRDDVREFFFWARCKLQRQNQLTGGYEDLENGILDLLANLTCAEIVEVSEDEEVTA